MTMHDDLETQLWDYIFDLLEPAASRALEERITSEPDVARAYAEVRQRADLLAFAARVEVGPLALTRPTEMEPTPTCAPAAVHSSPSIIRSRPLAWLLSSAAAALVCLVGYTWSRHAWLRDPATIARVEHEMASDYVRLVVAGPTQLQPELSNLFTLQMEDLNGLAKDGKVEIELADSDGRVLQRDKAHVDANADGFVTINGAVVDRQATLRMWCDMREDASIALDVAPAEQQYRTYLTTNQGVFAPGETLYFRTVTVPPASEQQKSSREFQVQVGCARVDAPDLLIDGLELTGTTTHGVGNGAIKLATDLPEGRYKLWAKNVDDESTVQGVEFDVARDGAEAWEAQVHFAAATAAPGEQVNAEIFAKTRAGAPVSGAEVSLKAGVNGAAIKLAETTADRVLTDDNGRAEVSFAVPGGVKEGSADLAVTLQKGKKSVTLWAELPTEREKLVADSPSKTGKSGSAAPARYVVDFYPEGGSLVAGLSNSVVFAARDRNGAPLAIRGELVDSKQQKVADVATARWGLGEFSFTPQREETYRLKVDATTFGKMTVAGADQGDFIKNGEPAPALAAADDLTAKLSVPEPIVAELAPLEVEVSTTKMPAQLLVCATSQGRQVGQSFVDFDAEHDAQSATQRVKLPLADEAAGVLQISLYNAAVSPPSPVAHRYVYRRPAKRWDLELEPVSEQVKESSTVSWFVQVRDEQGRARPAVLGINVTEEPARASSADAGLVASLQDFSTFSDDFTRLDLAARSDPRRRGFDGTLGGGSAAARGDQLAMLLGTLPPATQTFAEQNSDHDGEAVLGQMHRFAFGAQIAENAQRSQTQVQYFNSLQTNERALSEFPAPPILQDNLAAVTAAYERAVHEWRDREQNRLHALSLAICGLSIALLLFVALLLTLKLTRGSYAWLPALAGCAASLLIAGQWLQARIDQPITVAARPIANYDGRPLELASASGLGSGGGGLGGGYGLAPFDAPAVVTDPATVSEPRQDATPAPTEEAKPQPTLPLPANKPAEQVEAHTEQFLLGHMAGPRGWRMLAFDGGHDRWLGIDAIQQSAKSAAPVGEKDVLLQIVDNYAGFAPLPPQSYTRDFAMHPTGPKPTSSTTLYWNPLLETDANGRAPLRIPLPDVRTRYRITIDAHGDGRLGSFSRVIEPPPLTPAQLPSPK